MFSPSSNEEEPTSIRRVMDGFSSKIRRPQSRSTSSLLVRGKLSFAESVISEEDSSLRDSMNEGSFSKYPRFHDPLGSALGRKRFASERAKEVSSLEDENAKLKSEIESLSQEHLADKSSIFKLETAHKNAELAQKRFLLEARSEAREYRAKYEREVDARSKLLREIKELEKKLSDLTNDGEKKKLLSSINEAKNRATSLREDNLKLKEEIRDLENKTKSSKRNHEEELIELKRKNRIIQNERDEWKEKANIGESRASKVGELKAEVEKLMIEIKTKEEEIFELKDKLAQNQDTILQRNAMRQQLNNYPNLVKQIEILKKENLLLHQTQENADLLKEKIRGLESDLNRSVNLAQINLQCKHEAERLRKSLLAWESVVQRFYSSEKVAVGPELLISKIADFQRNELLLKNDLGEAQTDKKIAESRVKTLEREARERKAEREKVDERRIEQTKMVKKLQRKLLLVSKERDSYKSLLDSYEHEVTFAGSQLEKDRVSVLEKIITDHKDMISKLEDQLSNRNEETLVDSNIVEVRRTELETEILKIKSDLEEVSNERDHLRYELDNRAMKGDFNPHNTRVIQFKNNPMATASENLTSKITKLQDENQSLKTRIQLLEEGQTKDLTLLVNQKVEEGMSPKEVEELQNQVKSSEVKIKRMMDAFKKTSQDYRKLTFELTGFRIDIQPNDDYSVTSVYAENPDKDQLYFQRGPKGELLLLENNYAESQTTLIKVHLTSQNSIPAFLAGLTLELFSRQSFEIETTAITVPSDDNTDEHEAICID